MTHTRPRNTFSHRLSTLALVVGIFATSPASAAVLKADLNNDGYEDLVVGSRFEDVGSIGNAGAISVFYGTASGLPRSPSQQWYQDSPGIAGAAEADDRFGDAVAVGDFNRDGYDDVAIGVPQEAIARTVKILERTISPSFMASSLISPHLEFQSDMAHTEAQMRRRGRGGCDVDDRCVSC